MQKLNEMILKTVVKKDRAFNKIRDNLINDKKGVNGLVEVAGILAIVVTVIMIVMPNARTAVNDIWTTVTTNAKNFFNTNTI